MAKSLKKATFNAIPTAAGGITRATHACVTKAGLDAGPLLRNAGLTTQQVANPHHRIAVNKQIKFLDLAANAMGDEFLGLRLAQRVDLRELGLLYYVLASSERLSDALERAARYSSIINEGVRLNFRQLGGATMSFEYVNLRRVEDRHQIEFFMTILVRICRHLTGRRLVPASVKFVHRRKDVPTEIEAFFGCDVLFGTETDEVVYPSSTRLAPIVGSDSYLNSLLLKYCDDALAERGGRSTAWQTRVENAIASLLPHGQARMEQICRRLGVSRRTLVRRLASENQTFSNVLASLRLKLSKRYLRERDLPMSRIAWLLGYKDMSAFNHAFKRWTGTTPSRARSRAAESQRPTMNAKV
jgi:AraC-like DNA-binding protein